MGYAFISYSTKEQSSADAMKKLLEKQGIQTWMAPGDIPAGNKYARVINQAIKGCSCFVLMLSNNSQNSVWVSKEVERAVNYRKPIIPVQLEDLTLNDEFEIYISTDQVVAVKTIDENNYEIQKILSSTKAILENTTHEWSQINNNSIDKNVETKNNTANDLVNLTDNYYFKMFLSSNDGGSLFIYSSESESVESPASVNITEAIWNEFVISCKELLSSVFPGTPTSNISIKCKKPLGIYNCAPDDGYNYYDEKFRIDFKVSMIYKQIPKNYDSVHFDLSSDSFEISLFSAGNYVFKNTPAESNLSDFDINQTQVLRAAIKMIYFAQNSNSLTISDTFRRKGFNDGSGGYFLDFIEKDIESRMNEQPSNSLYEYHKKQNADKIKKCYVALGGIGCKILNNFENNTVSNESLFLYYDTDVSIEEQLNIKSGEFHLFKNFSQGLGGLRENGKKLLELSKYMDNNSDLYDIYSNDIFDESGIELIFVTTSFGGFGSGIVLDFQKIVKSKIRNHYSNEISIDTEIIAFTSDCFSFFGETSKYYKQNDTDFKKAYYKKFQGNPVDWAFTNFHLISKPNSTAEQLSNILTFNKKLLSLSDSTCFEYYDIQMNQNNEVIIPNGYTHISENSFDNVCIEKLYIPASVKSIHSNAFVSSLIKEIYISKNNLFYGVYNNELIDTIINNVVDTGSAKLFEY